MSQTKRIWLLAAASAAALWLVLPLAARHDEMRAEEQPPSTARASIAQGEYLAIHVAMCVQCHSPHNKADGSLIRQQLFQGGPLPVASPFPQQRWPTSTPQIAGLPGGRSEDDLVRLLTTGKWPDGTSPLPPMPPFRMTKEDAAAVAAYLKSLK